MEGGYIVFNGTTVNKSFWWEYSFSIDAIKKPAETYAVYELKERGIILDDAVLHQAVQVTFC